MKLILKQIIVEAVQLSDATWDGKEWSKSPFNEKTKSAWLDDAIITQNIIPKASKSNSINSWSVLTKDGTIVLAFPSDWIVKMPSGELRIYKDKEVIDNFDIIIDTSV
jgi:hypothetical protein